MAATRNRGGADLRGYGDSSKPPDGEKHANYSKRAMALDQIEVMQHFGFERFPVIGQDRGGRVTHRLASTHPNAVTMPPSSTSSRRAISTRTSHRVRPGVLPLVQLPARGSRSRERAEGRNDAALARATTDVQREYLRP
jgi:pimeloyl-ACP methyl ester carboxylesterase